MSAQANSITHRRTIHAPVATLGCLCHPSPCHPCARGHVGMSLGIDFVFSFSGLGQELVTKWVYTWSTGLILLRSAPFFELDPFEGVLGPHTESQLLRFHKNFEGAH